jgi:peptidyl-prolyl cis-trans isomerase C
MKAMELAIWKRATVLGVLGMAASMMLLASGCNAPEGAAVPAVQPDMPSVVPPVVPAPVPAEAARVLDVPPTPSTAVAVTETPVAVASADGGGVVVSVDGKKLLKAEMDARIADILKANGGMMKEEQMTQMRPMIERDVVNRFVQQTLIVNAADQKGIAVSDADVDAEIEQIRKSIPEGRTLEEMMVEHGMTTPQLREEIGTSLKIDQFIALATTNLPAISDEAAKSFYDENKERMETVQARHILITVDEAADPKTRDEKKLLAEDLRKQLVGGADFAALAKEKSDCPSKEKGGDLGTFPRGQMVKEFEEAAFTQKPDEIGPVVQTQFGYHIIQVVKHNGFEEAKANVIKRMRGGDEKKIVMETIEKLRASAKIEYGDAWKQLEKPEAPGEMMAPQ